MLGSVSLSGRSRGITWLAEASCSFKNASSSLSSLTNFSAAIKALSFSAKESLSSFSRLKNSSRSSFSKATTVGVCGRLSRSRKPSTIGLTGVMLRELDMEVGVGDVAGFLGGAAPGFPRGTHSVSLTCPPERHIASSASRAAICF